MNNKFVLFKLNADKINHNKQFCSNLKFIKR